MYTRKTTDMFIVQQNWGTHGWEDAYASPTRREALARLREYRENQPEAPAKVVKRRVQL